MNRRPQQTQTNYCICPKCRGYGADPLSNMSLRAGSLRARGTAKPCTLCAGIGKIVATSSGEANG